MKISEGTKVTIQNLLTVKSVVTILLTGVFAYLAIKGRITGEQFLTIFSVVIAFYFGTSMRKEKAVVRNEPSIVYAERSPMGKP